jgi:uncharacterized Tic20 family protein
MTDNEPKRDDDERLSRLSGAANPANDDEIIREYEQRYRPETRQKPKSKPRSYSTLHITDDEKLWSAVAHGSVWLTFLLAVPTGGISLPFVIFVPLLIYVFFRKQSDFIAFHALQAFVLQLICTVGALLGFVVGATIWLIMLIIAGILSILVIGIPLLILLTIIGIVAPVLLAALPLAGLILATIASVRVYTGSDFRYPYLANWVDRQMAGGLMNA